MNGAWYIMLYLCFVCHIVCGFVHNHSITFLSLFLVSIKEMNYVPALNLTIRLQCLLCMFIVSSSTFSYYWLWHLIESLMPYLISNELYGHSFVFPLNQVGNEERIHVYYAHGQDNPGFVRRCYWLLDKYVYQ